MKFKYQAPPHYSGTSIEYAGQTYQIKAGVIESDKDIYQVLHQLEFTRLHDVDLKKATTK